jgi:hypothetical protein
VREKKHTFWVEAGHLPNFHSSLRKIAAEIGVELSDDLISPIKAWLADKNHGAWVMVIDGLDSGEVARQVKQVLPELCGQVLITTRVRSVLKYFLSINKEDVCLHVGDLKLADCRKIFLSHAWESSVGENNPELDDLLKFLALPLSVKVVAKFMTEFTIPLKNVYDPKTQNSVLVKHRLCHVFDIIFTPLLPNQSSYTDQPWNSKTWRTGAFKLLAQLSCLCKDGIELELIVKNHKDEDHLWVMLGQLKNCSFIGQGKDNIFFMHGFVQRAVLTLVENRSGLLSLLQFHGTALCMLFQLYIEERPKHETEGNQIRRSSYLWKLRFMPHFERFLDFAKEHGDKVRRFDQFTFTDRMAKSVITFAQVYLDEGRYKDAVCVLKFAKSLYKEQEFSYDLAHLTMQAYLGQPLWDESKLHRSEVEDLSTELIGISEKANKKEQTWRLRLDLAKLHCKSKLPDRAFEVLRKCARDMELVVKKGTPQLIEYRKTELPRATKKELVIDLRIEEAHTQLAVAKISHSKGFGPAATKALENARTYLNGASLAITKWFPKAVEWLMRVDERLADVLSESGTQKDLEEAEKLLKNKLDWLEPQINAVKRSWSQKGSCDLQCKIARIQLKRGMEREREHLKREAIHTLTNMLERYEKWYGIKDGHTQKCATWLRDALSQDGQEEAARNLGKRIGLKKGRKYHKSSARDLKFPTKGIGNRVVEVLGACLFLLMVCFLVFELMGARESRFYPQFELRL